MIKKLTKHGTDLALVFDRALLDQLHYDESTRLKITVEDKKLVITPVDDGDRGSKVRAVLVDINERYGNALRNLAE